MTECENCGGSGIVPCGLQDHDTECGYCHGSGEVDDRRYIACKGLGITSVRQSNGDVPQ